MERLTREEMKEYQMEILNYIDSICHTHNLKYSLAFGTLLGGVRHQGYIPWDDDVDIMLPYPDYKRLMEIVCTEGKYLVVTGLNTKHYFHSFSKIIHPNTVGNVKFDGYKHHILNGVYIDLFPIVAFNSNTLNREIKRMLFIDKCKFVALEDGLMAFKDTIGIFKSIIRLPYVIICKLLGETYWKKMLEKCMEKGFKKTYDKLGIYAFEPVSILPKETYSYTKKIKFEEYEFESFIEYDSILKSFYGDYMKLPPEEERIPKHAGEIMYRK